MSKQDSREWKKIKSEQGPQIPLFGIRYDWMRNPRNGVEMKAVVLESPDWVDVVAITPQNKIVVVCQYRFGIGRTTTEIPAGLVEPGETPEQAIQRELCEETGYSSNNWKYLGWVESNPAFINSICHQWLAVNVVKTNDTDLDASEDVAIGEYSLDEVCAEIQAGRMRNPFSLLALSRVFDLRDKTERERYGGAC